MRTLDYKSIHRISRMFPLLATYLATIGRRRNDQLWHRYWKASSSLVYDSFLGKIKLAVSLPGGLRALIRPFSSDDQFITEIFEKRVYERCGGPKLGDVVIDAGAHIGLFTMKASKLVGSKGLVIAVEPHPENYRMLLTNIKINSLKNVVAIKTALGNKEGFTELFLSDRRSTGGHSIVKHYPHSVKVPIITLDQLVKKLSLLHVDFIKLDVESAEYMVLQGTEKTLTSNKVHLSIETGKNNEIITRNGIMFLKKSGYYSKEIRGITYAEKG